MIKSLDNTATLVLNDQITERRSPVSYIYLYFVKRLCDIICGLIGLIILIPITIIVKIITICSGDFHSIFYTQDRIGLNGKTFKLYKFRSMIPNADEELKRILKENKELAKEYKKMKKLENDPRITKIGKILRVTSIDELPQMLNIFLGDMSVIGNRPYLPREKEDMGSYYDDIIKTKPGLTGFWQVSLRSRGTFEQRLKMEKYYSNNRGLRFDISIFFKTFSILFIRGNAK